MAVIAFSAEGQGHESNGKADLLEYDTVTSTTPGWDGASTFTVPVAGHYFFAISFVKDAFNPLGTQDDVYIELIRNKAVVGRAWSGEGAGMRGSGMYHVILDLKLGDKITTRANSDGGKSRFLPTYQFSAFRIAP